MNSERWLLLQPSIRDTCHHQMVRIFPDLLGGVKSDPFWPYKKGGRALVIPKNFPNLGETLPLCDLALSIHQLFLGS